jgi:hypothetical protein
VSAEGAERALPFATLRQALVAHAQAASSQIWSDFNIHDPGVTMLEQTAFALSELAFRANVPIRDLLTGEDGAIDLVGLGLGPAAQVLSAAPVSLVGIKARLAVLPQVANVDLDCDATGRVTARIVPQDATDGTDALIAVKAGFAALRPLCTHLVEARICTPRPVRLQGDLIASGTTAPEDVVAAIWMWVNLSLRGVRLDPEALGPSGVSDPDARVVSTTTTVRSGVFAALRGIEGLRELLELNLVGMDDTPYPDFRIDDPDSYLELGKADWARDFAIEQNGARIALDPARADRAVARLRTRLHAYLWSGQNGHDGVHPPVSVPETLLGRPRHFDYVSVNATLPMAYRQPPKSAAALQVAGYRALIDTLLGAMTADLAQLPRMLSGNPATAMRHQPHIPKIAQDEGLISDTKAWAEVFARHEPSAKTIGRMFDFLLAIQGEEMPAEGQAELDRDVVHAQRPHAGLHRRARLLKALPALNARRATGPDGLDPGGVLGHLLCLIDMNAQAPGVVANALAEAGLRLDAAARGGRIARSDVQAPQSLADLIVPERDVPAAPVQQLAAVPFCEDGALGPALLHAAALSENWLICPTKTGWRLLVETQQDGSVFDAGCHRDRETAIAQANALRGLFAALNRACEGAWLIEDVLLCGPNDGLRPYCATLVLPGWSLRCASRSFRLFVEQALARISPAYCQIRPLWMEPEEFAEFARLHALLAVEPDAGETLRAVLYQGPRS